MFRAKEIELASFGQNMQQGSIFGKNFAVAGGVTASVLQALKEKGIQADIHVKGCNGAAECKKALMLLKAGKLPEDFLEGMSCEGGCVNGPGAVLSGRQAQLNRTNVLKSVDDRAIYDTVHSYEDCNITMHRK